MKELKIIHLKGTQAEMGVQYAKIVLNRGDWEDAVDTYTKIAARLLADANCRSLAGRLSHGAIKQIMHWGSLRLDKVRPPQYRERNYAFMETLGVPARLARQYLLMDLFQNVIGLAGRWRLGPFAREAGLMPVPACSSLVVWGDASADGALRHARNFDFTATGLFEKEPVVVTCTPDDGLRYGYVGSFGIDLPGITGFNEAGIVLTAHTRFHRDISFSAAAVVDLCHDVIRRAETLDDAIKIAKERPAASTWGFAISSASEGRAVVVETTAKRTVVITPLPSESFITATNMYRHPETMPGQLSPSPAFAEHCDGREGRLQHLAQTASEGDGLSRLQLEDALGDHTDPFGSGELRAAGSTVSQSITVQSVIFESQQQSVRVSIGDTPTGWGPYVDVPWNWDAPVGMQIREVDETAGRRASGYDEGPKGEAYALWVEATRVDLLNHDPDETRPLVLGAVERDPTDTSYRFMAAILELRRDDLEAALEHLDTGLEHENATFRRALLLLWTSRVAQHLGLLERAKAMRAELQILKDPHIDELQQMARKEERKPYSRSKFRKVTYNMMLVDAL